ncbi:MAG: hypothetical protein ABI972_30745 [Acidobacteriota bacterium]
MTGQTVGDYVVVQAAGHDHFSGVYAVEHTITRRREAMRILGTEGHCPVEDAERFFKEIRHRASLSHPNIAGVHNAFWAGDSLVMISEWVDGESLRSALTNGPLPLTRALEIVSGVLQAVAYAHANGIRNCTPSPEMIFITRDGVPKLLNIGLAASTETQNDLHACGVIFHELVTGSEPVSPRVFPGFLQTRCEESVLRSLGAGRQLAEQLKETISRASADEPSLRFPTVDAFLDAVTHLRQGIESTASQRQAVNHSGFMTGAAIAGVVCTLILVASALIVPAPPTVVLPPAAPPSLLQASAPVTPPISAVPTNLKPARQPDPPLPAASNSPKKNPITRLGGAIKRLNPIDRLGRRQSPQTQAAAKSVPDAQ